MHRGAVCTVPAVRHTVNDDKGWWVFVVESTAQKHPEAVFETTIEV